MRGRFFTDIYDLVMGSSFISYKENGFWARDFVPSVIAILLVAELNKQQQRSDWLEEFRDRMICAACGYWGGFNTLELDSYLTDRNRTGLMIWLLDNVLNDLLVQPYDLIAIHDFDHLLGEEQSYWSANAGISKEIIVKTIRYIQDLLKGESVDIDIVWDY